MSKVENRVQELWDEAVAQGIRAENKESGSEKFSERENPIQAEFEQHVDEIENNTYKGDSILIMGVTPKVLQKIGMAAIPIGIDKNHVYSIAVSEKQAKIEKRFKAKFNYHNLGFQAVKDIYEKISDPLMVIAHPDFNRNKEQRDSTHKVVVLVDLSINNKQVIAPVEIDFDARYKHYHIDVNRIATYFDKSNINDYIKEAVALENNNKIGFFYINKKRAQGIFKQSGYQLPSVLKSLSSNIIIREINENVNRKILDVTQSQQFIRWFGDWQNNPQSASKVVDKDGKPLVVYHGTGSKFNVFDKSKIGENYGELRGGDLGFYFTPYEDEAKDYAKEASFDTGEQHVVGAYLSLKNPLIVKDSGWGSAIGQADVRHKDLMRWAKEGNHDGIIVVSTDEIMDDGTQDTVYIAFEPEQIKSATDNIGTFDKNNPDINYSDRFNDTDYLSAVERGDMKTAQQMVDEAARCVMLPRACNARPCDCKGNVCRFSRAGAKHLRSANHPAVQTPFSPSPPRP